MCFVFLFVAAGAGRQVVSGSVRHLISYLRLSDEQVIFSWCDEKARCVLLLSDLVRPSIKSV